MKVAIHQPMYLAWQPLFSKIASVDLFVFFDDVQYPRSRDFFNRNIIKTLNGEQYLTVPVKGKSALRTISEIKIDNDQPWQRKHWQSILMSYRKTSFFSQFKGGFEDIYQNKSWEFLCDLNVTLIKLICNLIGIQTQFKVSSDLDLPPCKGIEHILNILKATEASQYVTGQGPGSLRYMDERLFKQSGIEVVRCSYNQIKYPQLWGDFISELSIVDLLFNCGTNSKNYLMKLINH